MIGSSGDVHARIDFEERIWLEGHTQILDRHATHMGLG